MKAGAVVVLTVFLGCATSGGLRQEPLNAGETRNFAGSYDAILKAARDATVASGLHLESVDKVDDHTWTILAKKDASAWSWGELVRVVIQQTSADTTSVRIISRKEWRQTSARVATTHRQSSTT